MEFTPTTGGLSRRGVLTGIVAAGTAAMIPSSLAAGASSLLARREIARGPSVDQLPRRFYAAAVSLEGGYSLITGGYPQLPKDNRVATPTSSTYLIGPDGSVSAVRPMRIPRARHGMVALPEGRVAVIGGYTPQLTAAVDIYDPYGDAWMAGEPISSPAADFAAVWTPSGILLVGAVGLSGVPATLLHRTPLSTIPLP